MPFSRQEQIAKAAIREHGPSARTARRTSPLRRTNAHARRLRIKQQACASTSKLPLQAQPRVGSAWTASMGDALTNYFGKCHTPCGRRFIVEDLIMDWFPTTSTRLAQHREAYLGLGHRVQLFRPWFNTSSPNIVPTPTSLMSRISTGAQLNEMLKPAEKVRRYGCQ